MTTTLVQQHSRQSLGRFANPSPTKYASTENMDKVVQSVTNATKRLSQISTNTNSSAKKRKTQNRIGPWKLGRTLGRGSTGRVRLAKNINSGKLAAVKIVPKSNFKKLENPKYKRNSVDSSGSVKDRLPYGIEREIIIMKLISHPNIMGLYDVWENKNDLYLILEYIEGGELFDYLIKKGKLQEFEAINYFKQIINGIHYLHQFNICHRDLKPENLLLDFNKNIKIADFGMAALEVREKLLETSCGSPHYASPEIVAGKNYHGAPSDIWSCGIILFALLTGHLPFDDENIRKLLLKVQNGKFLMPNNLSPESKDLISKMLKVNPSERITIDAILQHPLLTKYPEPSVRKNKVTEFSDLNIKPIDSINNIDKEILKNLSVLFHNRDEQTIISKLLSPEDCSEKTFYYLLVKYRNEHLTVSNNAINNYEDDPDLTGSDSKQTITRSTSIVKTITTDQVTGEKHTTIRKIPNSNSNLSNKSRSPKKRSEVLGNITNTAPTFKASTSFNRKKTIMNNTVISRNNSSKSLRKRPPQQEPPKLSRKISGMAHLNDLRLEKTQLNSLYKQHKLNGTFGNKSLFNFESVCQEIFGNTEQSTKPEEMVRKDKQTDGNTGKLSNIEKCERELAAKVHEKNDARDLKLKQQQEEEIAFQHKKELEIKKRDQSKLLQEKQRQALEKLGSQIQSNNDNDRRGTGHRTQQRYVTEPTPTSSLDPRLSGGTKSLLRAKSLASPSSYVSLRQNAHTNDNTSKVLQKLGIDVAPLKTSTKFNSNLKTSSSKNLADYLNNEASNPEGYKSVDHQKENISMNKFNEKERANQSIIKPNYSRLSVSKVQSLAISRTTTLNSMGYRSLLDGIDENKIQKDLPKRPNADRDYDNTLSTIETRKNELIPNPRFSRFSFNGLLNSRFDNPDVTIQNNITSSGTVVRKSANQKESRSSRTIEEDTKTSHLKLETGSLKKSSTNLLGLGIQNQHSNTSRKVSQNSGYCDSNFVSVNLSDTADDSQDNSTLEENAISLNRANSEGYILKEDKEDHANETVSKSGISEEHTVDNNYDSFDQKNKRKSTYLGNLDCSKETLVENDKDEKSFQDSIKSMYKDYAKLYNDKRPKSGTDVQEPIKNSDNMGTEENVRQSIIKDDKLNVSDSDYDLSFAADGSSNIDILDSSSVADTNMNEDRSEVPLDEDKYSPTLTDNQKDFDDEFDDDINDQFSQQDDQQEDQQEYNHEYNREYNQQNDQEQYEHGYKQQNEQQGDNDLLQTGADLRKSTASTQIFSTMNLPKIRDRNSVVEENIEMKVPQAESNELDQRHNSIFQKLKPKREAPKAPGFKWGEEKPQGHNRFSRISVSSKQQKLNDNYNDSGKSNWFMKLIYSLTANTKTTTGEKRKSLIKKFNPDKLDDIEAKNFYVLDSTLQASELTRVIKDTLELKKIEGSVSKVDIDEDFGMISGVIPAKYSGGRRLKFKIEIINLKNTSSLHLSKIKGTDKGFKNLANIVKFIVSKEEQNMNRMSSVEA
ncbi:uncharacterized protein AC631_02895 [Debaryomyces fabryi]|uniref:non-specific serine/threonine protein kinase n=1 Tax=Debaryomyces fabryi TaxID=58627 RepID=A0A0V1PYV5_9ASCO|nr:uncharacterized protein AC631_02895 [Debaryomyces fabryi]KSA01330.1 hypothetical protein AC631_02895 [Debaryomyces fabryi]CUM46661.1 unnamed protein product [Debaryomyces fabryi]